MTLPNVLLVDDDADASGALADYLDDFGYKTRVAQTQPAVAALLQQARIDIVVMDLALSQANGLVLMQEIRRQSGIPVVVLSRRHDTADRIIALELGADDYLCKPCEPRELLARIKAILRRLPCAEDRAVSPVATVRLGRWELRRDERRLASAEGETVSLSASEYRLLNAFIAAPRRVLSRAFLMEQARGRDLQDFERSIDLLVSRLRRKMADDLGPAPLIRTVRGQGYVFEPQTADFQAALRRTRHEKPGALLGAALA